VKYQQCQNSDDRLFEDIAILRGNLGKSEPGDDEEEIVSESESEYDQTEQEVERELEIELEFI